MLHSKKFKFDPEVDVQEVDQFGFVDLNEAFTSGKIPASAGVEEGSFDAVGSSPLSPSQIGGRPSDVFEAYEMRDNARAAIADANAKRESANSAQSAPTE